MGGMGSEHASRAGFGVLAGTNFVCVLIWFLSGKDDVLEKRTHPTDRVMGYPYKRSFQCQSCRAP